MVTPEEVMAGEIRHALSVVIPNTSYGPICTPSQQGTSAEGVTCGTAVAPASKFEWGGRPDPPIPETFKSIYTIDKTVPEGMLFGLDITYEGIDEWIRSRPNLVSNPRRAETARIYARALKDYGMIIADTSGSGTGIEQVGGVNPDHAAKWKALGMGPEERDDMLVGLITATNLYVVNPPKATCKDGTITRYYCEWTSISY